MTDRCFPTDPRGLEDHGDHIAAKPCAKRIDHAHEGLPGVVTWCTLPSDHDGQCSGAKPRVIEVGDFGPKHATRRRW